MRLAVLLLSVALRATYGLMRYGDFKANIRPFCYNMTDDRRDELVAGQTEPMANSIETFLSLLEKLEAKSSMSVEQTLEYLLTRYRLDDLKYEPPGDNPARIFTKSIFEKQHDLIRQIVNVDSSSKTLDDDFTDGERCSLYYMLSHTVNDTARRGEPVLNGRSYSTGRDNEGVKRSQSLNPREQGVVSLRGNEKHSIALGRVLLGLLAALRKPEQSSLLAVYNELKKTDRQPIGDLIDGNTKFNYVHAATFADIFTISMVVMKSTSKDSSKQTSAFGQNGRWNSTLCTTEYRLDAGFNGYATYSMFRGAADGLLLGLRAREIFDSGAKLSQVLRMYYTSRGIPLETSSLSFCNRKELLKDLRSDIQNQVVSYACLYSAIYSDPYDTKDQASQSTRNIISQFDSNTNKIFDEVYENSDCDMAVPTYTNPTCETPNDVFFVLDAGTRVGENFYKEREVVSKVTNGMDLRPGGSSVSVLANVGRRDGAMFLVTLNSTSVGCPGCKTAWFSPSGMATMEEIQVIKSLNTTLNNFEAEREKLPGVPGKVVVYFNYMNPSDRWDLKQTIKDFQWKHRDVPVLTAGLNRDGLRMFVQKEKDLFSNVDDTSILAGDLLNRICETPATLQYDECWKRTDGNERTYIYTGSVTPNYIQYWAMYPEYFIKSYNIKFQFSSDGGDIKVCYSRDYDRIVGSRGQDGRCLETSSGGGTVEFTESNPCKKRNLLNCEPFYFAVIGKKSNVGEANTKSTCKDPTCKSTDQIIFTVRHTGISCNGAGVLLGSLLLTSLLVLLTLPFRH